MKGVTLVVWCADHDLWPSWGLGTRKKCVAHRSLFSGSRRNWQVWV